MSQQIVRLMQDAGFPTKIHMDGVPRTPEAQNLAFKNGKSRAKAWQGPHNYYEACDIIHADLGWEASKDFWDTLQACVEIVEEKYDVQLIHGGRDWGWDLAHVQSADWKKVKQRVGNRLPTLVERQKRFAEMLPKVWERYLYDHPTA